MWLVGVVIRRYIDILIIIINFPYSTCIRCCFGSTILTSLLIFKVLYNIHHVAKNTIILILFVIVMEKLMFKILHFFLSQKFSVSC